MIDIGDLQSVGEIVAVVLLVAVILFLVLLPDRIAERLAGGDVASSLERIDRSAAEASKRVQKLNDELAASEELGRWRSIMQTALGTVIGLGGGFMAPWVTGANDPGEVAMRAILVLVGGAGLVLIASTRFFPHIDARIRSRLERKTEAAERAPS